MCEPVKPFSYESVTFLVKKINKIENASRLIGCHRNVCVCVCSRSGSQTLQQLPACWLTEVLQEVKSSDPASKLCATRRSAGIPFYIQVGVCVCVCVRTRVCVYS